MLGAKEGATNSIVAKVGTQVTDSVLRTPDNLDNKFMDKYEL